MTAPLDSDLLRTFIAVADHGNFTRAGETVGRTQSAVSMQIRKLEDLLGEHLFDRGSRGVSMTRHGLRLIDNARRIVALLDDTAVTIRQPALDGAIRIGISEEYMGSALPKALGAFVTVHPGVEVSVLQGVSVSNLAALEAGEIDIAVVFEPGGPTTSEVLTVDPTVWVTSDQHRVHERFPVPIATYTYLKGGWCDALALKVLERRGIQSRIAYSSLTSNGLSAAVSSGLAIAPMTRSNIPAGCRELTAADGYDIIDFSNVVLKTRLGRRNGRIVEAMSNAIRDAFRTPIAP